MNLYYGSNTFHMRHITSHNITLGKGYEALNVKCYTPQFKGSSTTSSAHSIVSAYKAAAILEIKCIKIGQFCRPHL